MKPSATIRVIPYEGYKADERPAAVLLDGERLKVKEIEDTWISTGVDPDSEVIRGFVVRCSEGKRFRLLYSDTRGWRGELLPGPQLVT